MDQKKLRSILATYDDYYTALYHDRNNPQQPDEFNKKSAQQNLFHIDRII